jgi:hypothetical protein
MNNTSAIVNAVLAAVKETDVWKFVEDAMRKAGTGPNGLDDQSAFMDGADDLDLGSSEMDLSDDGFDGLDALEGEPVRMAYGEDQDYGLGPVEMDDGRQSRGLQRYERKYRQGGHDRYGDVPGYRGRLTEGPTDNVHGISVHSSTSEDARWEPMDDLLQSRDRTNPLGTGPNYNVEPSNRTHPKGSPEDHYAKARQAQRMAEEAARKWIKGDCDCPTSQYRDEAGRFLADEER